MANSRKAWQRGTVVIASTIGEEDRRFEFPSGYRGIGFDALQCSGFHDFVLHRARFLKPCIVYYAKMSQKVRGGKLGVQISGDFFTRLSCNPGGHGRKFFFQFLKSLNSSFM
jgi:hypothetical protein